MIRGVILFALVAWPLLATAGSSLYSYRDENGVQVYSDVPPAAGQVYERQSIKSSSIVSPVVTFRRELGSDSVTLWADNPCYCVTEVVARAVDSNALTVLPEISNRVVVPARSMTKILTLSGGSPRAMGLVEFETGWILGDPQATHTPGQPYRPPFAAARQFLISQAFPDAQTHSTPDSRYAVDIAMPEQTTVYAARGGVVIDVAHSNFRGGDDFGKFGAQANLVKIVHDDGSIALYAHLSWDSIRVRPGQRVERGEAIAASGNTGFSTGPHLHFVVVRNAGLRSESVPVSFSAAAGQTVTPRTGEFLLNP